MFQFGSGTAIALPYGSHAAGNPTPLQLGTLQETSIDVSATQKELMGKLQFPVAIARAAGKVEIKFKFANVYAKILNDVFFGASVVAGSEIGVIDSAQTPTSSSVTITPPGSGTFARDLGVREGSTGAQLTLVPSGTPTAGQYKVASGTYTFADSNSKLISYTYTLASTGFKSAVTNQPMGYQPVLDVTIVNSQYANLDGSVNCLLRFPAVIASKISLPYKNEDFLITEVDCGAFADGSGNIMYLNVDQ